MSPLHQQVFCLHQSYILQPVPTFHWKQTLTNTFLSCEADGGKNAIRSYISFSVSCVCVCVQSTCFSKTHLQPTGDIQDVFQSVGCCRLKTNRLVQQLTPACVYRYRTLPPHVLVCKQACCICTCKNTDACVHV